MAPLNVCVERFIAASPVSVIAEASGGVTHMWPFVLSVVVTVPLQVVSRRTTAPPGVVPPVISFE